MAEQHANKLVGNSGSNAALLRLTQAMAASLAAAKGAACVMQGGSNSASTSGTNNNVKK